MALSIIFREVIAAGLLGLVATIYVRGFRRRRYVNGQMIARGAIFLSGLALFAMALVWPLQGLSESLFFAHEGQIFILRMIGPLLIALSQPQGVLLAGLPRPLKRTLIVRPLSIAGLRTILALPTRPIAATALLIGVLVFWQIPRFQDATLAGPGIDAIMHATFLASGLIFWFRIFDLRPDPKGVRYGVRLMMLWLVMLSGIALGSYTTLKQTVLYEAYGLAVRAYGYTPLGDEQLGGLIIWIVSAFTCLAAVILTIHAMGVNEERLEKIRTTWTSSNWAAMAYPSTGEALIAQATPKNRIMAAGLSMFSATVFAAAILVGVFALQLNRSAGETGHYGGKTVTRRIK